jgi:DNA-binding response OmpR family regulator
MKIMIAEDDPTSNLVLKSMLLRWGFDVVTTFNGADAWKILQGGDLPQIAIIDWVMPGIEGLEVCRRIREMEKGGDRYTYVVILTGKDDKEDIVTGIRAGADDYIT